MRTLVVTEKCAPALSQRDGGARIVTTLRRALGVAADVMQFDDAEAPGGGDPAFRHRYPRAAGDRFALRLARSAFIADRVGEVAARYTHVLYVHVSMAFGARPVPGARTLTLPMFLTPSYAASGEVVPAAYTERERAVLASTDRILTPSHLERRQLVEVYGVDPARVRVVPRGIDCALLSQRARELRGAPLFCHVGSIKRQKNTLGLIQLFRVLREHHPGAHLRIVGPTQDAAYAAQVRAEITRLGLGPYVELVGHVAPEHLAAALADAHVHLSAASCETFGRAIFETLASGLPNVAHAPLNAAAEYLDDAPYARFVTSADEVPAAVEAILAEYPRLSAQALEVGELFDDAVLGRLLAEEIAESEVLAVADFDGTLYHQHDDARTRRCVAAFQRYRHRVVCSARALPDLLATMESHGITAAFVVGWSGAVAADGAGRTLWRRGFTPEEATALAARLPAGAEAVTDGGTTIQFVVPGAAVAVSGARVETYQGVSFVGRWENSKLRAVHRLLRHIDWRGRVRTFGDGRYDLPLLTYFDGTRVRPAGAPHDRVRQAEEITHEGP